MNPRKKIRAKRSGAAAVEFALVAPLLLVILTGIVEIGRRVEVTQIMTNAAREGGRLASGGAPTTDVDSHIRSFLVNAGLSSSAVAAAVIDIDGEHVTFSEHHAYKIVVTIPCQQISLVPSGDAWFAGNDLRAECVWVQD